MKTTARCLLFGSRKQFFITTLVAALLLAAAPAMADTFNITVTAYTWYPREGLVTSSCTDTDTDGLAGVSVYCETSSPVGSVSASGGGNAYSGFLVVGNMDPGTPGAEVTLSLQGMYYLTGTGTGSIDFGEAFSTGCCSTDDVTMLFNGVSYQWSVVEGSYCHGNGYTSEDVGGCPLIDNLQFGVGYPVSVSIYLTSTELAVIGYDLTAGLSPGEEITAVPEPASALLLLTGIPFALFRRARKRKN